MPGIDQGRERELRRVLDLLDQITARLDERERLGAAAVWPTAARTEAGGSVTPDGP